MFFCFHPYLGKISILTNVFQMGWNHQLETLKIKIPLGLGGADNMMTMSTWLPWLFAVCSGRFSTQLCRDCFISHYKDPGTWTNQDDSWFMSSWESRAPPPKATPPGKLSTLRFPMTTWNDVIHCDDFGLMKTNQQALGFQKHVFGFIGHTTVLALPRKTLGAIFGGFDDDVCDFCSEKKGEVGRKC